MSGITDYKDMKKEIKEVIVTPSFAEELLKMNINNRKVRQVHVDDLAAAMRKGEWTLSNDAIVVSEGNILLNGQHRLLAVIKSGVSCPFILYTGAEDTSYDIMDTPTVRRVADVLSRNGGVNTLRAESAINKYLNLCYDKQNEWMTMARFNNQAEATRRERVKCYDDNRENLGKWLRISESLCSKSNNLIAVAAIAGFALFLENKLFHSEDKIISFLEELLLDGKVTNTTVLYARKKLLRHKMKVEIIARHDVTRYLFRAWNDYVLGKQVQIIKTNEDSFRNIYPL